jgi:Dienelactone hydrolase family
LSISPNTKKNASLYKQTFRGCDRVSESVKLVSGESMTADQKNQPTNDVHPGDITRRDFAALLVGASLAATVQSAAAAGLEVAETDVEIKTPDGTCDAAFIRPKPGSHPGVLIWPDAFGLRPSMRAMARRLAGEGEGYAVLVPNPFYRVSKAPFTDASTFSRVGGGALTRWPPSAAQTARAGFPHAAFTKI